MQIRKERELLRSLFIIIPQQVFLRGQLSIVFNLQQPFTSLMDDPSPTPCASSMEQRDSTASSAPLKKRSNIMLSSNSDTKRDLTLRGDEEHAMAEALFSLRQTPTVKSNISDDFSDSRSVSSNGSTVMPVIVHKPPQSSTMVDHTYTDYSVVDEELLSFVCHEDDQESACDISEDGKRSRENAMKKIKKIFGENVSPSKKNSGGVLKPFPEKVRFFIFVES